MAEEHQEAVVRGPVPPRVSRGQQRRRQRSVFQYITILFAAALVLLLYTFMMEHRQFEQQQQQDQANINNLQQQSVSTVQTLKGMTEENEQLREEVEQLNQQLEALNRQLADAQAEQNALQGQIQDGEKVTEAMTWFWQLNDVYVRGRLSQCRELIESMEEAGLAELLPEENLASEDFLSPASRYEEIRSRVMK